MHSSLNKFLIKNAVTDNNDNDYYSDDDWWLSIKNLYAINNNVKKINLWLTIRNGRMSSEVGC